MHFHLDSMPAPVGMPAVEGPALPGSVLKGGVPLLPAHVLQKDGILPPPSDSLQKDGISPLPSDSLQIGGMVPLSTGDYPDCLSAVVFCQGCPWRCRYCHNPHLQVRNGATTSFSDVLHFLQSRAGLLDAVVFSGGEPTYQEGIYQAVLSARKLGFKIGMHTAAPKHDRFLNLLPLLDWVGLDIKALPADYAAVTGVDGSAESPFQALAALVESDIDFEVRTTLHPLLIDGERLLKLASRLSGLGVRKYALQVFRRTGCQDEELNQFSTKPSLELVSEIASMFEHFDLRE